MKKWEAMCADLPAYERLWPCGSSTRGRTESRGLGGGLISIMWHVRGKTKSYSWLIFLDDLNRASSNRGSRRLICKFSVPRWTRHGGWCHLATLHAEQTHTHTLMHSLRCWPDCAPHTWHPGAREKERKRERCERQSRAARGRWRSADGQWLRASALTGRGQGVIEQREILDSA